MRRVPVFLQFVFVVGVAFASSYVQGTESANDSEDARTLLKRIQYAGQRLNYSGTFVYQQGNQMRTSRITHLLEGRNELEKLEILDGKPREYIRRGEEITCYVPESKTVLVEKRVVQDAFPAILAANPADLFEHYNLKKGETGRVAGFNCQAVVLEPKDNLRYGYKLWADKSSGLLLRAQTLNDKGEIVEQIAFAQVVIGNIDRNGVKSSVANTSGWHVENAVMSQINLAGWAVKSIPPGFKKVRELRRLVSNAGTSGEAADGQNREVSQIVFSDGLAAISIFIEPGSQSRTEGSMQQGALNIIGERLGDYWLTIVGEVPFVALKQVADSIEFNPK